ncbi:MAG: [FeFe] hydrogenase H-cluster maturation GTPase HydF [Candidatus Omnitrophota bacterium]
MEKTPKSLRLHIGIFGRTNVGKSSFLNLISGQDAAITSPVPGTTTDVVEKPMELLPVGPVVFLDTAGLDDKSKLAGLRIKKTKRVFDRSELAVLLTEAGRWGEYEELVAAEAARRKIPLIAVVNKIDLFRPSENFLEKLRSLAAGVISCSCMDTANRDSCVDEFKKHLLEVCPEEFLRPPSLIGDLLPPGGLAMLIVPIDLQAPKGRLILPQVQVIRDALDNDAEVMVVKEREYSAALKRLTVPPNIVVCDSQVVLKMVADTPENVKCTTFSILFSRYKGDLIEASRGAASIERLKSGDRILIAEACSHHAIEDDIGRVKIPRWLRQYLGCDIRVDVSSGSDYPENLASYNLVVHCGGCMINRREMISRIDKARSARVAITNYGVAISALQGAIRRTLAPFPAALDAYLSGIETASGHTHVKRKTRKDIR